MATALNATSTFSCPHNGTAHDGTLLCHWTNSPGGRGTLNIFWLCISTLALCVWNAVQPDVPRPNTPWWRVFGKRVWMLFVGLFIPEMLVLVALGQLRLAWKLLADVDEHTSCPTEFPWWMYLFKSWRPTRKNSAYESKWWMRGLLWCLRVSSTSPAGETQAPVSDSDLEEGKAEILPQPVPADEPSLGHVEHKPSPGPSEDCDTDVPTHIPREPSDIEHALESSEPVVYGPPALDCQREHPWTLTHSFYAVMHGFVDEKGHTIVRPFEANESDSDWSKSVLRRIALPLDDRQRIPDVSADDIEDRGKAGVLAKSLLIWQLFVFLANCFARWDQSLPLSLLEITTIGHSLCTIIAMALWWYKPHSISEATVINRQRPLSSPSNSRWRELFSWSFLDVVFEAGVEGVLAVAAMDVHQTMPIAAMAVLYGLPHLLGLSIHFPTFAEQLCWTVATSVVIGSPLVMCGIVWIMPYVGNLDNRIQYGVGLPLIVLLSIVLVLFPIASMFLVGESVRQIFALPVESFREPQLPTYLPSFS